MTKPLATKVTNIPAVAPAVATEHYPVGLVGEKCATDAITLRTLGDNPIVTLVDGYATLEDGKQLLVAVFEAHGLGSYVERAAAGLLELACTDGNPLNCDVSNITVYQKD